MNYIGKVISNVRDFYKEINSATLTGAIDVIVVEQENGSYLSSPFHVRFGKMGVLRSKEKIVDIEINGEAVGIHMKLGDTGEAFFIEEIDDEESDATIPNYLATSPLTITDEPNPDYIANQLEKLSLNDNTFVHTKEATNNPNNNNNIIKFESICDKINENHAIFNNSNDDDNNNTSLECHNKSFSLPNSLTMPKISKVTHYSLTPPINSEHFFKNIDEIKLNASISTQTDNSNYISGAPISSLNTTVNTHQKRLRRKKKSSVAKKAQQKQRTKEEDEEIFQMDDDIYDEMVKNTFSASVPILDDISSTKSNLTYSTSFHDFYPYSDSEISGNASMTPKAALENSRPSSPCYKSDSEYEIKKFDATSQTDVTDQLSWQWGELPHVPRKTSDDIKLKTSSATSPAKSDDIVSSDDEIDPRSTQNVKNSMLGGVLNFMKQNKSTNSEGKESSSSSTKDLKKDGIYLDELNPNDIDPEVAALYFPKFRSNYPIKKTSDDDAESGNGPSLPHSPHSLDVCPSSGAQSIDSGDSDQERTSLCTNYDLYAISKAYHDLSMSLCGGLEELNKDGMNNERFIHSIISFDDFSENPSLLQNANLVIRMGGKFYNWQTAAPIIVSLIMFQRQLPDKTLNSLFDQFMPKKEEKKPYQASKSWWGSWRRSNTVSEGQKKDRQLNNTPSPLEDKSLMTTSSSTTTLVPSESFGEKINESAKPMMIEDNMYLSSGSDVEDNFVLGTKQPNGSVKRSHAKYRKKLRLSSDEIKNLNLHEGSNEVVFSVTTAYQGTTVCKCQIYLWRYDDRIIISDIDGTITKSDVLGHLLPIIGRDWAHSGVANLFTKIHRNGYKFLYLSARAIGQARVTREYLRSIRQGDICLPDGPLLLSPTSLISALHREVIEKKPEEFKISCLKDIASLYPHTPFYAGFGNKINDTWAYRAVDINLSRIFTINHRGELKLELIQTFQSSYTRLSDVVDQMFPSVELNQEKNYNSEFNSFEYWREMLPEVNYDELVTTHQNKENQANDDTKKGPLK